MTPLIAIPAAGSASRMQGRDKLLEPIDGTPLLRRQTNAALATDLNVLVLIRPGDTDRRNALPNDPKLQISTVPDASEGMAATLRRAAAASGDQPLMILLPDVPGITTEDIQRVLSVFVDHRGSKVVRASGTKDRPGTPICLPAKVATGFSTLKGDEGGRSILNEKAVELVRLNSDRATRDLNTPEDWAAWRAEHADD